MEEGFFSSVSRLCFGAFFTIMVQFIVGQPMKNDSESEEERRNRKLRDFSVYTNDE
jgi:hypothetical protein